MKDGGGRMKGETRSVRDQGDAERKTAIIQQHFSFSDTPRLRVSASLFRLPPSAFILSPPSLL